MSTLYINWLDLDVLETGEASQMDVSQDLWKGRADLKSEGRQQNRPNQRWVITAKLWPSNI